MNELLELKGHFETRRNLAGGGAVKLPKGSRVTAGHLSMLRGQLQAVLEKWEHGLDIGGALVSVHYVKVVAKSNRIGILLSEGGGSPSESIRGAKFEDVSGGEKRHVFTHFVSFDTLRGSIEALDRAAGLLQVAYDGAVSESEAAVIGSSDVPKGYDLSKTAFLRILRDAAFVERFDVSDAMDTSLLSEASVISLYRTGVDARTFLNSQLGMNLSEDKVLNETTVLLDRDQVRVLCKKAPSLIAMGIRDMREIEPVEEIQPAESVRTIPKPGNEPVVGVIDTPFDSNVYFHEWVDSRDMLPSGVEILPQDRLHGTGVASIIVDGPYANPELKDGCGYFRVRHFGVATAGRFSAFEIVKTIRRIVSENQDIKVWNLSLGSMVEVSPNFISPEAAELDRIQKEFDVIFVVAGTNLPLHPARIPMRLGAPADSLNSIVVNSVNFGNEPASYSRVGPVLSFFNKPDVSYYGGDGPRAMDCIVVNDGTPGASYRRGTSYAAPWVARKLAYLICTLGFSREVAKALLVDAAGGWTPRTDPERIGYGIVPRHISQIVGTPDDEIRFILSGVSEEYETYTYALPVPTVGDTHPYFARATLVYFPWCDRNQGVDYTGTELDVHFGRVQWKNGKPGIKCIDDNTQGDAGEPGIKESDARDLFRKWDNVKRIAEIPTPDARARKAYDSRLWGLSIKSKARNAAGTRDRLPFGVVVTLKEMRGVNRIDEFIQQCQARGWIVNRINVKTQVEIYTQGQMELPLE